MLAEGQFRGQQGRARLHLQAPKGRQLPQRQGDDLEGRRFPRRPRWGRSRPRRQQRSSPRWRIGRPSTKYTVEMKLKEKSAIVLLILARRARAASRHLPQGDRRTVPAEEKATEYRQRARSSWPEGSRISTSDGPLRQLQVARKKPNGHGGGKTALPGRDPLGASARGHARGAGGDGRADFADDLNLDSYDRLKKRPTPARIVSKPYYWLVAVMNKQSLNAEPEAARPGRRPSTSSRS